MRENEERSEGELMLAMRREFLEQILTDPQWSERFEVAETTEQLIEVVEAYCKEKKFPTAPFIVVEKEG